MHLYRQRCKRIAKMICCSSLQPSVPEGFFVASLFFYLASLREGGVNEVDGRSTRNSTIRTNSNFTHSPSVAINRASSLPEGALQCSSFAASRREPYHFFASRREPFSSLPPAGSLFFASLREGGGSRSETEGLSDVPATIPQSLRDSSLYTREPSK